MNWILFIKCVAWVIAVPVFLLAIASFDNIRKPPAAADHTIRIIGRDSFNAKMAMQGTRKLIIVAVLMLVVFVLLP